METTALTVTTQPAPQFATFLKTWIGGPSARIVEMANAGKRGKKCREATLSTWTHSSASDAVRFGVPRLAGDEASMDAASRSGVILNVSFDDLLAKFREIATEHPQHTTLEETEIRGIDAPKPTLTAGNDKFSASLDNGGVHLYDLTDMHNEPRTITHDQSEAEAYRLGAKVWDRVQKATTYYEASNILREAGCRLHSYCAVD